MKTPEVFTSIDFFYEKVNRTFKKKIYTLEHNLNKLDRAKAVKLDDGLERILIDILSPSDSARADTLLLQVDPGSFELH